MSKSFTLEASGTFPFTFYVEKAVASDEERDLVIEGVASTTNVDHDNERMSKEALTVMANIINEKSVPLRVEHSKSDNAVIGSVHKAWVDERNQLHIRAKLDKAHPVGPMLHHAMKELGKKMGFSVGGIVKRAVREFSEAAGTMVKTFYDVELKEVSVTPRPANYDSWAVSKSIARDAAEAELLKSTFYDEFLFENPQLDYLQAFAKSVPEEAWRKVNKTDMSTETETKEKATETATEDTEKAVTRGEFNRAMGVMSKGIATIAEAMKSFATRKMDEGETALDQRSPDKAKPTDESPTAKRRTQKAESDEKETETEKDMDVEARDQNDPAKDKPTDESPTAKASEAEGSDTEGEREKASKESEDTYDMETVTRATKSIETLIRKMSETETEEKTKSETEAETKEKATETETETREKASETDETEKGMSAIDQFVVTMAKAMEVMAEKMEKSGTHVLGFEKSFVDSIKSDPVIQASIRDMLQQPGFKKSVSRGIPYMVTKGGKMYALTASEVGESTVEKARKQGADAPSFKELYKAEFSTIREGQQ